MRLKAESLSAMLSRKTELMHLFEGAMLALRNSRARELNELHCGNFHVAPLLVRTRYGKRRRSPCTAADLHSRMGGSCTFQRRKMLGPRCIAIQKTVAVIIQSSN